MSMRLAVVAVVASLALAGCKKASEKVAEKAIEAGMAKDGVKADVKISGDGVTVKSQDGTTVYSAGKDSKVPENFPKDVHVYEGATIVGSVVVPEGFNLMMETKDPSDKVVAVMKEKMAGHGWKIETTMNQGKHTLIVFKNGERTATLNTDGRDSGTQITVTAVEAKKK